MEWQQLNTNRGENTGGIGIVNMLWKGLATTDYSVSGSYVHNGWTFNVISASHTEDPPSTFFFFLGSQNRWEETICSTVNGRSETDSAADAHTHTQTHVGETLWLSGRQAEGRDSSAGAPQSNSGGLALWHSRLKEEILTHRGTPGRRCQAVRSERREETPLMPQMEGLGATPVRLLVTLHSQPGTGMDGWMDGQNGRAEKPMGFWRETYLALESKLWNVYQLCWD